MQAGLGAAGMGRGFDPEFGEGKLGGIHAAKAGKIMLAYKVVCGLAHGADIQGVINPPHRAFIIGEGGAARKQPIGIVPLMRRCCVKVSWHIAGTYYRQRRAAQGFSQLEFQRQRVYRRGEIKMRDLAAGMHARLCKLGHGQVCAGFPEIF